MQIRYSIIGIFLLLGFILTGCQLDERQQQIKEREQLRDSIRITDSISAQHEIDSFMQLTDSIQKIVRGDTLPEESENQ